MKIKLSTMNAPLFNVGDLGLREGQWTEFDTAELTAEQRQLIETYTGQIIQVEPGQLDALASELGVEVYEGKLRKPEAKAEPTSPKPSTPSTSTENEKPVQPQPITSVPSHPLEGSTTTTTKKSSR